jgi:hypothetical protein
MQYRLKTLRALQVALFDRDLGQGTESNNLEQQDPQACKMDELPHQLSSCNPS